MLRILAPVPMWVPLLRLHGGSPRGWVRQAAAGARHWREERKRELFNIGENPVRLFVCPGPGGQDGRGLAPSPAALLERLGGWVFTAAAAALFSLLIAPA